MSRTRKILAVALVIGAISLVVSVISAIINPEAVPMFVAVGPGIITVALCIALLLLSKKDDGK